MNKKLWKYNFLVYVVRHQWCNYKQTVSDSFCNLYYFVTALQLGPQESKLTLKVTNNLLFLTVSKPMRINWEPWKETPKKWVELIELIYPQHALFCCRCNPRHLGSSFFRTPLKLTVMCFILKPLLFILVLQNLYLDVFGNFITYRPIYINILKYSVIICFRIRNLWYRKKALSFSTIFVI